jgi:hypothetical protein
MRRPIHIWGGIAAPGADRKAWFQVQANNQGTAVVQAALQRVFETAGWTTETVRAPYGLKSGIFILAGDEQPPATNSALNPIDTSSQTSPSLFGSRIISLEDSSSPTVINVT